MPPSTSGRPAPATTPFGVGEPHGNQPPFGARSPQPFGSSSPQAEPTQVVSKAADATQVVPPTRATDVPAYPPGFDPEPTMAVPTQRPQPGTVYGTGGYETIDATMPVSTNPVENSGSLTGHILAQGWRDEVVDRRRGNLKVAVAMLVVLGLLVTVSVVFLLTAGNSFSDWIGGVFS
ncbi:hypothetical protein M1L60_00010 [Actinoplanes sp. TRM 88003]|uniref:Serine protease n=1 Tax=Paractinoplanes aksuensis TaxID=2939490 RepID=A0ABT1DDS3_9ACTN|nr:hypothetical protein [Actinoplanes aksuensis]MCO8268966.1 hypothetical protein [Actinoplanes aksuensis]